MLLPSTKDTGGIDLKTAVIDGAIGSAGAALGGAVLGPIGSVVGSIYSSKFMKEKEMKNVFVAFGVLTGVSLLAGMLFNSGGNNQ